MVAKKKNKYETIFLRGKRQTINEATMRIYLRNCDLRNNVSQLFPRY